MVPSLSMSHGVSRIPSTGMPASSNADQMPR
ncbi:Uncharacterised protein [Mycobacteroides abscessus subsp. abscessus]|nr:Uncharacterised protein [Mycobacteroides abscessus subsp. abscessus]